MKLTRVEPFSKAAPGFNKKAAEQVYKAVMAQPDNESAAMFVAALVFDVMDRDVTRHAEFLSKAYKETLEKRSEAIKEVLVKKYVSARVTGADVEELSKAADWLGVISKAPYDFQDRSRNASRQRRNAGGRFVKEHSKVPHDRTQPIDPNIFDRVYGVKMPRQHEHGAKQGKPLSAQEQRNWQIAYAHAQDVLGPYGDVPGAKVHIKYDNSPAEVMAEPKDLANKLQTNRRAQSFAVSVDNNPDLFGAPNFMQMGQAFGAPTAGASMQASVGSAQQWQRSGLNPDRLRQYADANEDLGPYALQPGARLFRRMETGSTLLQDTLGDNAPDKLKAALGAGKWIGEYGPEAQRVLGPSVQRTGYRYRGVERKPDSRLQGTFNQIAAKMPNASAESRMQFALYGGTNEKGKATTSPVLQYFKNRLPKANLNTLQVKSGTVPPSEGIILDKNGKIVTQAVGYGDDHYLPFNLKNVGRMKGGSYIRTRTFGGPTTEDVYTALVSGANSLTVVSHNGVYTMQFDESFKGGRRYNDKAARMVARYGQILDAVNSGEVTLDLMDPARVKELRQEASRNVRDPDDPDQIRAETERLTRAERLHPKLSEERLGEIKQDVLRDYAENVGTKGKTLRPEDLRGYALAEFRNQNAAKYGAGATTESMAPMLNSLYEKLDSDDALIEHFGLKEKFDKATDRELAKTRRDLSPLSLNGRGYELALDSLQEQFPYYIDKPTFQEWNEFEGKKDTGYVKPKHIRPADAWAGYFDSTINGHGKVHADSVAYGKYRAVKTDRIKEREAQQANAPAPGGGGGGSGYDPSRRSESSGQKEEVPELVKQDADRKLAQHLISVAAPHKTSSDWMFDTKSTVAAQKNAAEILSMTDDEIDEAIGANPERFHTRLNDAVKEMQGWDPVKNDIDPSIISRSRRRGAEEPIREVPNDPSLMLSKPEIDYEFGHKFNPGKHHDAASLTGTFNEDSDIRATGLPMFTEDGFGEAASKKAADLREQYVQLPRMRRNGQISNEQLREMERQTRGVIKAKQLKRRYDALPVQETPVQAAAEEVGTDRIVVADTNSPAVQAMMQALGSMGRPQIANTAPVPIDWDAYNAASPAEQKRMLGTQ